MPDTGGRQEGIRPYLWTLRDFARDRLLRFAFAEADASRGQLSFVIVRVERELARAAAAGKAADPALEVDGQRLEEFDALVDFVFNEGAGTFSRSSVLSALNAGNYAAAKSALSNYTTSQGTKSAALVRRRQAEQAMWGMT